MARGKPIGHVPNKYRDSKAKNGLMAAKMAAKVKRISNANDAGFGGEDAFQAGDDEISLSAGFAKGVDRDIGNNYDELGLRDNDEVLPLRSTTSGRVSASDNKAVDQQGGATIPKIAKTSRRKLDPHRELLPLSTARTSRFERPKQTPQSSNAASASESSTSIDSDDDENPAEASQKVFDDSWLQTGGYHVSKREIAKDEARKASWEKQRSEEDDKREELEYLEARRIQRDAKQRLTDDAFGLDDNASSGGDCVDRIILHCPLSSVNVPAAIEDREDAIAHLMTTEPELLALVDDLGESSERLEKVRTHIKGMFKLHQPDDIPLAFACMYSDLLAACVATLSFFLYIRSQPDYRQTSNSMASAVLIELVRVRTAVSKMEDMDLFTLPGDPNRLLVGRSVLQRYHAVAGADEMTLDIPSTQHLGDLEEGELAALLRSEHTGLDDALGVNLRRGKKRTQSCLEQEDFGNSDDNGYTELSSPLPVKSIRKRSRKDRKRQAAATLTATNDTLLNLQPTVQSTLPMRQYTAGSDFLDATSLTSTDAEDKANRKKSLRFYTSRIESTATRRAMGGRQRSGGDEDVPYRSKERARASILQRQHHATTDTQDTHLGYADFDDAAFVEARATASPDGGYYDLIAQEKKKLKESKNEAYEQAVQENRAAIEMSQTLELHKTRAVNRQIMANKGLTPGRPKSVRNPRVKKRMRYEQAKKKVASMKSIYKGGLLDAKYEGEKSGISSKVVKSRAL